MNQPDAVYIDVNTSACGLGSTPTYFTSLTGLNTSHGQARGTTSIYTPTATGFRVYLQRTGITPATAQFLDWRIQWRAETASLNFSDQCNGATSTASTTWVQDGANRVYTNVNTSACSIATTPGRDPARQSRSSRGPAIARPGHVTTRGL